GRSPSAGARRSRCSRSASSNRTRAFARSKPSPFPPQPEALSGGSLLQYQTFRGSNVNEALAAVRAALGPEAVIDSTRYVTNGRRGALGYSYVEISAAPPKRPTAARPAKALPASDSALPHPREARAADAFDPQSFARELESMRA